MTPTTHNKKAAPEGGSTMGTTAGSHLTTHDPVEEARSLLDGVVSACGVRPEYRIAVFAAAHGLAKAISRQMLEERAHEQ